ncbi:AraC-like ligand-binding domain-containing protein [Saccharopolyspora elongata]|uniref:Transcription regulator HTH AraC- type ligand binding domain-containing protein n=1 Tax=Saccharopolyspora elongata TaxID=2530387 RepID=A0A4R4YTU9_9PSEU|nr:hypothetical protein [Saccharopolyspora elongata]TDD48778.1 hypothetical protein E1288_21155 [Saccharopolyspora elongata]
MGALERYMVLRGSDVDEFRTSVSRFLTPHLLTPVGRCHSSVTADLAQVSLGPVSLVYGRNAGAELGVRLLEQVSYYDVNLALAGRNLLSCAGDEVLLDGATAGIISPKMIAELRLSDGYSQLHARDDVSRPQGRPAQRGGAIQRRVRAAKADRSHGDPER